MGPAANTALKNREKYFRLSLPAVRRMLALARPYRSQLIVACILTLLSASVSLAVPLLARTALDGIVKTKQIAALDHLAVAMAALILVGAVLGFLRYLLLAYTGHKIVLQMRQRLFAHLQRLPVVYFDRTRSGDLGSRLSNDVSLLQETLTADLVYLVGNIATVVGGIGVVVVIDWRLTGVVVCLLIAMVALYALVARRLRKLTRAALAALSDAIGTMTEVLANIRLTKAFAREAYEDQRVATRLQKVFYFGMKSSAVEAAIGPMLGAGFTLVLLGVLWYGGQRVLNGSLSPGSLLAFLMTLFTIGGPLGGIAGQFARLNRAVGVSDWLFALLDEAPEPPDPTDALPFPAGFGRVTFDTIDFAYTPDIPVLTGLTLEIPAGKVTALVGASGAGKTTLAALLYRFYEPQAGLITIEGVPIHRIGREALRTHIGLVPQEPILFNGSIRENIQYGRLDATEAEVKAAAEIANVAEFVAALPDGYETIVGERGITLSGGQRQRVAIARAVLKDPRILILDEATSSLDTRSESLVREALERLMQGRTTLVIAHRLTTIRDAHQIAVLDSGRVVECGVHAELLDLDGQYAALHGYLPIDR